MKKLELTPAQLRGQLARSLAGGLVFALAVVFGFRAIRHAPEIGGAAAPLRQGHLFNERIWGSLWSPARQSPEKPRPPAGKVPRANGDIGLEEAFDPQAYRLEVVSGSTRLALSLAELALLPRADVATEFKCIEGWSEDFYYSGYRFSDFLRAYDVGRKPDGSLYRYVALETPGGEYYVSIDMDSMLHPQTLLATEMNERPLRPRNGAPLRLLIPIKYGIKSLKRVGKIYFADERPPDYWAEQGYDWYAGL
jgi:DMSO/TMAO reductase YedYZ molybdopterin-dependent catalytic subunit